MIATAQDWSERVAEVGMLWEINTVYPTICLTTYSFVHLVNY